MNFAYFIVVIEFFFTVLELNVNKSWKTTKIISLECPIQVALDKKIGTQDATNFSNNSKNNEFNRWSRLVFADWLDYPISVFTSYFQLVIEL